MRVHAVDGTYELFRAYFGAPSRKAPDGTEVGAAAGLGRSLISLLRQKEVTHVGVAFDHVIESFRNDLFDGYKTGEGLEPELYAQFPLAERVAHALGVAVWPMVELEADDALATAAEQYAQEPEVEQVILCTPDKDLAQCVEGERIVCLDRRRERVLDADGVVEKFGVPPASIPDWLALVGDSADGIPGIKGWGARSSATVLSVYEHIEKIPDDPAAWSVKVRGAARLAETLAAHREEAALYRTLATLRRDACLPETLEELRWTGPRQDVLQRVSAEMGDDGLLRSAGRLSAG